MRLARRPTPSAAPATGQADGSPSWSGWPRATWALPPLDASTMVRGVVAGAFALRCVEVQRGYDTADIPEDLHYLLPADHLLPVVLRPHPPLQAAITGGLIAFRATASLRGPKRRPFLGRSVLGLTPRHEICLQRLLLGLFMGAHWVCSNAMVHSLELDGYMLAEMAAQNATLRGLVDQMRGVDPNALAWSQFYREHITSRYTADSAQVHYVQFAMLGRLLPELLLIGEVLAWIGLPLGGALVGTLRRGSNSCRRLWGRLFAEATHQRPRRPPPPELAPATAVLAAIRQAPCPAVAASAAPQPPGLAELVLLLEALARSAPQDCRRKDPPEVQQLRQWLSKHGEDPSLTQELPNSLKLTGRPTVASRMVAAIALLRQRAAAKPGGALAEVLRRQGVAALLDGMEQQARAA